MIKERTVEKSTVLILSKKMTFFDEYFNMKYKIY